MMKHDIKQMLERGAAVPIDHATTMALVNECLRLRSLNKELAEALEPFVRYYGGCLSTEGVIGALDTEIWLQTYDDEAGCAVDVTIGDFRTAWSALTKYRGKE